MKKIIGVIAFTFFTLLPWQHARAATQVGPISPAELIIAFDGICYQHLDRLGSIPNFLETVSVFSKRIPKEVARLDPAIGDEGFMYKVGVINLKGTRQILGVGVNPVTKACSVVSTRVANYQEVERKLKATYPAMREVGELLEGPMLMTIYKLRARTCIALTRPKRELAEPILNPIVLSIINNPTCK